MVPFLIFNQTFFPEIWMSMFPRLYVPPCLYPSPLIGPPFTLTLEKVIITGKKNIIVMTVEKNCCYAHLSSRSKNHRYARLFFGLRLFVGRGNDFFVVAKTCFKPYDKFSGMTFFDCKDYFLGVMITYSRGDCRPYRGRT